MKSRNKNVCYCKYSNKHKLCFVGEISLNKENSLLKDQKLCIVS